MADYKRMVSYMYQYEGGVKKKNVGFARIEAKDGQCKITLHMQLLGQLDSIFPTYLIQRGKGRTELINIGDTFLKNQVMDSRLIADEENIMASGYGLNDMGGLLLFLNDNVFFATEWDDKPITAAEVLEALRPKHKAEIRIEKTENKTEEMIEEKRIENEETVLSLEEELALPKYKLPRGYKIIERIQKPEVTVAKADRNYSETQKLQEILEVSIPEGVQGMLEGSPSEGEQEMLEGSVSEGEQEMLEASVSEGEQEMLEDSVSEGDQKMLEASTSEGLQVADYNIDITIEDQNSLADFENNDLEMSNLQSQVAEEAANMVVEEAPDSTEEEQPDPKAAIFIFEKYPRIYPFEDNEILLCVKIEPKDIGLLPKDLWALSNNSFLVHGYYCYHHLIFAKLMDRYGSRFILGVPGIYHERERFMARMFGFESFKPIRRRELRQGDFGYWYMQVSF